MRFDIIRIVSELRGGILNNKERMLCFRKKLPSNFYSKLEDSIKLIVNNVPELEEIYLFGSVARNDYKWDSDIDLAVITQKPLNDHALRGMIIDELDWPSKQGIRADVIFRYNGFIGVSPTFEELYERDKKLVWRRYDI